MSSMDTTIADAGLARSVALSQDAYPQALLALPPGEARESLLAVHGILRAELPKGTLSLYEAGGGSTSFIWGMPYFYGRHIYIGIEQRTAGTYTGPYFAY